MAPEEKQHKKRLKEAENTYSKSMKAFKQGKISKEDLKDKLRPYKHELKELGYPVKIKDDDRPKDENKDEIRETPIKITYKPWKNRSSLTIEEIESRVDTLSYGAVPSDSLKKLYLERYGEDLLPPENLLPFESVRNDLPERTVKGELPAVKEEEEDLMVRGNEEPEKKPFWKSLFKGAKKDEQELERSD